MRLIHSGYPAPISSTFPEESFRRRQPGFALNHRCDWFPGGWLCFNYRCWCLHRFCCYRGCTGFNRCRRYGLGHLRSAERISRRARRLWRSREVSSGQCRDGHLSGLPLSLQCDGMTIPVQLTLDGLLCQQTVEHPGPLVIGVRPRRYGYSVQVAGHSHSSASSQSE